MKRAYELNQPLDEARLVSSDASTVKSYVSFDNITMMSYVDWNCDGDNLMTAIRGNSAPKNISSYINEIFGKGKLASVIVHGCVLSVVT